MNWVWFHRLSSPKWFYRISGYLLPWVAVAATVLFGYGLYVGFYDSPPDYQQGESVRIMYLHVPAAMMSMAIYVGMAIAAAVGFIWRIRLAHMVAIAIAPIGAVMTTVALLSGSFWGRPTWGTWWEWDARLTSELILLFLYLGFMAIHAAFEDRESGDRAAAVLAIVGVVNIPIIHYSVYWWNSLHQKATITRMGKPLLDEDMKVALYSMIAAVFLYCVWVGLLRIRAEILDRDRSRRWVQETIGGQSDDS
jgi:heme exporter protein C